MNRIDNLLQHKKDGVLSVYFTAGYPKLNDTVRILELLEANGADMAEIGIPFSDPLADGPVIQQSSQAALQNGMSFSLLIEQLKDVRKTVSMPLILMGYLNSLLQFGIDKLEQIKQTGIDGLIIPDLPPDVYETQYKAEFERLGLHNILLITPRTNPARIQQLDRLSKGFIYAVSSSATTGNHLQNNQSQEQYFERLQQMKLQNPLLVGFGIRNHAQFKRVNEIAAGAIIGSAFIEHLTNNPNIEESIPGFLQSILHDHTITT